MICAMSRVQNRGAQAILMALEADEVSARGGFACLFSTADEYETALISQRRAQGRYGRAHNPWPMVMFLGCALLVAVAVALWH
jgi:hypothetical protein